MLSLLLLSCAVFFVSCDEQDPPQTPAQTVEIPTVDGEAVGLSLTATQTEVNKPLVTVNWDYKAFDFATYQNPTLSFYYGDKLLATRPLGQASSLLTEEVCFGKVNIRVSATKDGQAVLLKNGDVPVFADEYNVATLNASMPVLYFSLDLFSREDGTTRDNYEATNATSIAGNKPQNVLPLMANVPTFIALERVNSYDWRNLPANTYAFPSLDTSDGNFHANNTKIAAYIRELYEINPTSRFHFYCVDNYPELILQFFVAQGIENYDATMISDGTGTISIFQRMTSPDPSLGATADEVFDKMAEEWVRLKTAAANGVPGYLDDFYMRNPDVQVLENYAFVIATLEDNVNWWCARESLFRDNANSDYITDLLYGTNNSGKNKELLKTNITFPSFGSMFSALSRVDAAELKQLYKFDADVFSVAGDKQVLMVLGTSTAYEGDLEAYLTLLQQQYGATHQIFYKGHPGWPTALTPERQEILNRLGIIDVESYIAAEIILFYCPDIDLAGYHSSTYYSAQDERIFAVFSSKAASTGYTYQANTYISRADDATHNGAYADHTDCYVIEYGNSSRVDIYAPATGEITNLIPAV